MTDEENLVIFKVICGECERAGVKDQRTNIYVNWEKRFYMVNCLNPDCKAYEIFDEKGQRIVVPTGDKNDKKEDPEKVTN